MQKHIKLLRVVFSAALLAGFTFLFLDFSDKVSPAWYRRLLSLEFVPSLDLFIQSVIHGLSLTAWGWLIVLVLTLLFGRVYCSFLCPLGILQDVISFVSRKWKFRKRPFRFKYKKPLNWVRYPVLIVVLLSLTCCGTLLVNLLDPYSNFGRIVSDLLRPLYIRGNNVLAGLLEKMGSYALYPIDIIKDNPFTLIIPVVMVVLLLTLATVRGRIYCNSVCPVGTLLGLVSKVSLFRPVIDTDVCNRCTKCLQKCKAQCINIKAQKVDTTRCVGCFNCVNTCEKGAIRYRFSLPQRGGSHAMESDPEDMETVSKVAASGLGPMAENVLRSDDAVSTAGTSRRSFVVQGVTALAALTGVSAWAADNAEKEDGLSEEARRLKMERKVPICPPGSRSLKHFTNACTACHLCVSACPTGVLRPAFLEYGITGIDQPRMDFFKSFCNQSCTKCGEICPTGAILPLTKEEKVTVQIGHVTFMAANCIVTKHETSCGSCAEHCPTKAVRMVPYKGFLTIPHTDTTLCLGCGACQFACPIPEKNAIFVVSNKEHVAVTPPEEEVTEYEEQTEFPF